MHIRTMKIASLLVAFIVGIATGVGATMVLQVRSPNENVGDWLAFIGALIGVVVTILGTLAIENVKGRAEESRNRKTLLKSLKAMDVAMQTVMVDRAALPIEQARPHMLEAERHLFRELDKFVYARHYVPRNHVDAWYAVETLQDAWTKQRSMLENETRIIDEAGDNVNVFAVHVSKVSDAIANIRPYLEAAKLEVARVD